MYIKSYISATSFASTIKHNYETSKGEGKPIVYVHIFVYSLLCFMVFQVSFSYFLSVWRISNILLG